MSDAVMYKEELFTRRVRAGKRTYYFDVKSTKSEKDFYVTITESKKVEGVELQKHKIFLYKEDFEKFLSALQEATSYVESEIEKIKPDSVQLAVPEEVHPPRPVN